MMIQTFIITARQEELFDVLETAHVNMGHKRTRGKILVSCDLQKHSLHLSLSKFLFLSFSHGSCIEK